MIKNFNQLKNNFAGLTFTMIKHDWFPENKLMNVPRKILKVSGRTITFEGGSRLDITSTKDLKFSDNQLTVSLDGNGDFSKVMVYQIDN